MTQSRNWLARYRDGQRPQVWHELRQLGAAGQDPDLLEEVQLVCDEMARRARQNIEVSGWSEPHPDWPGVCVG